MTAEHDAYRITPPGHWMAGRARNLTHRSGMLAAVGGATFAVAFGLLLWFTRAEREALQRVPVPADTVDLARQAASMRRLQFRADSILADVSPPRRIVASMRTVTDTNLTRPADSTRIDTTAASPVDETAATAIADVSTDQARVPDAVRIAAAALASRLQRAQNAPLASSWRALAADPLLQQDATVRALADSLVEAERARNDYDALGGVDPIYLELSSRVTAIGRAIERSALQRIAAMLTPAVVAGPQVVQRIGPSAEEIARRFVADSARYVAARARRDAQALISDSIAALLSRKRTEALARDSARMRAQRRVDALAPPLAMLGASAAAAIGVALLVALLLELRSPRLADDREVVNQARLPLLLSIRTTDAATPDALTSAFSQLVFDLESSLALAHTLVVTSDDALLASRTAAHIAERLGYDGRNVRIVSPRQGTARMTTRERGRPTPTSTQSVLVQPERSHGVAWTGEFFLESLTDDTITVRAGTLDDIRQALTGAPTAARVILVVRVGSTPTAWLVRARAELHRAHGASALGVVIWAPGIDEGDPVQYALDNALQRALDAAPAPGR
ncbi:MAG TPA: hypothetical protein VE861_08980 [Gemmatimonadaceae bacterium]|nr:hypothetical protein [Gemmatimonadaceae bacterium]